MAEPLDINLSPKALKSALSKALNNKEDYGVFHKNPKYPNRRNYSGEIEVKVGNSVSIKWDPKLREGYIDVEGAKGATTKSLKADFDKVRSVLPKDSKFGLNPGEAKNAAGETVGRKHTKHLMYKRWFKNDSQVSLNADEGLRARPGGSQEGFILDTSKPKASKLTMATKKNQKGRNKFKNKVPPQGTKANALWRLEGEITDSMGRDPEVEGPKAEKNKTLLNPVSRPSGPKADKFFKEQKAYWEKHGKSSGEYYQHEGQRWRLDRKNSRSEIKAGKPVRYSFKSVEEKLSGTKKSTTQRDIDLKNTTLDPKASQQFHTLIPGEKGFESSPRHHAAAARTVGKLHEQFEKNLNPKWKRKDGATAEGKNFIRNIQNRADLPTGDSPANIRVYKSDKPGSNRSKLHTKAHRLGADLGIDPQKVNFKGMNNAQLWDYAKNTLAPAVKKIDKEIGYVSPYKTAGQAGAALRGKIPKQGGAEVTPTTKPRGRRNRRRLKAAGLLGGLGLISAAVPSKVTATTLSEGKYKDAAESYVQDLAGTPQSAAFGGALATTQRLLTTKAGRVALKQALTKVGGVAARKIGTKVAGSLVGGPAAPAVMAALLAKDIYEVTDILSGGKVENFRKQHTNQYIRGRSGAKRDKLRMSK